MNGSDYSPKEILKQEPATLVAVLSHFFALAIALHWLTITPTAVALVSSFVLSLLTVFYIRPLTNSKDALAKLDAAIDPGPPAAHLPEPVLSDKSDGNWNPPEKLAPNAPVNAAVPDGVPAS